MKLFQRLCTRRKRDTIKSYIVKLGPLLASTYGRAESYSPERVRNALLEGKFSSDEAVYALVLFCTPEQFAADQLARGQTGQYWPLRTEIVEFEFRLGRETSSDSSGDFVSDADNRAFSGYTNIG